ncbi:MAG: hypothetical protein KAU95_02050, partial [Candidatus Aenigmarchaeota archaeon]|nr:hypothetical protein [Candidatus Aenigmarchaeota archaeon]
MNKNYWTILYFLIPLMVIIPPVTATPVIEIIYPNGGEILNGTENIIFNVSDSTNPQTLFADIHYSADANTFLSDQNIVSDLNLLSACNFSQGAVLDT